MAKDSKALILDLAIAAIDAGGESAIKVNDIVAELGLTPPVLYYHFGSRNGLVIAAQVARYSRQVFEDIARIGEAVAKCSTRDELRETLIDTWSRVISQRSESRWVRTSAVGSAYGRPELETALAQTQDAIVRGLCEVLEPSRKRGWFRPGIDLPSAVAWQHSVLMGRVYVERGHEMVDPAEWDRLTLEAFVHAFFG